MSARPTPPLPPHLQTRAARLAVAALLTALVAALTTPGVSAGARRGHVGPRGVRLPAALLV